MCYQIERVDSQICLPIKKGEVTEDERMSIGGPVGINLVPRLIDHCQGRAAVCRRKEKFERLPGRSIEKRDPRRIRRPSWRRRLHRRSCQLETMVALDVAAPEQMVRKTDIGYPLPVR